jgi:hypothetical protein
MVSKIYIDWKENLKIKIDSFPFTPARKDMVRNRTLNVNQFLTGNVKIILDGSDECKVQRQSQNDIPTPI